MQWLQKVHVFDGDGSNFLSFLSPDNSGWKLVSLHMLKNDISLKWRRSGGHSESGAKPQPPNHSYDYN